MQGDDVETCVLIKGRLLKVTSNYCPSPPPKKKKGQTIFEFSNQSRMRCLRFSATVDWPNAIGGRFITLTYPPQRESHSAEDRKKHLYVFHRSLEKYLDRHVAIMWRVEWLRRQSGSTKGNLAPHIHLLTFSNEYIPFWLVNTWWQRAIDWKQYVRTECRKVENEKQAGAYVSKYVAKSTDSPSLVNVPKRNKTGRHYGYKRAAQIPRCAGVTIVGTSPEFLAALRDIGFSTLPDYRPDCDVGFTLLGDNADMWKEVVLQLAIDEGLVVEYDH